MDSIICRAAQRRLYERTAFLLLVMMVQRKMVRVLVAAALGGGLFHLMGVLVVLDLGTRLGRMMGPRHRRCGH